MQNNRQQLSAIGREKRFDPPELQVQGSLVHHCTRLPVAYSWFPSHVTDRYVRLASLRGIQNAMLVEKNLLKINMDVGMAECG